MRDAANVLLRCPECGAKAEHDLRALLTPTITDSDVDAAALSLAGRSSWAGLSTYIKNIIMDDARACLEAVAAARQRATGSGVR